MLNFSGRSTLAVQDKQIPKALRFQKLGVPELAGNFLISAGLNTSH
jgi:hypothetical protein